MHNLTQGVDGLNHTPHRVRHNLPLDLYPRVAPHKTAQRVDHDGRVALHDAHRIPKRGMQLQVCSRHMACRGLHTPQPNPQRPNRIGLGTAQSLILPTPQPQHLDRGVATVERLFALLQIGNQRLLVLLQTLFFIRRAEPPTQQQAGGQRDRNGIKKQMSIHKNCFFEAKVTSSKRAVF